MLSLVEKASYWEWADPTPDYALGGYIHEEVADHDHPWPRHLLCHLEWHGNVEIPRGWKPGWRARREGAERVLSHRVYRLPGGTVVEQRSRPPQSRLRQRVFLPDYADWIELEAEWQMSQDTHPEATYLAFPFALPGATARFDAGGQAVIPEADQLPGVCHDYFTVQNWADFNDGERGVTIAMPENPLIQLGGFHFGHNEYHFNLERALLVGWVTNNYWETNFRAHQPGMVYARYRILPYDGAFDRGARPPLRAGGRGRRPLVNHLQEPVAGGEALPPAGTLLRLPEPPVLVVNIRHAADGGLLLYLLNASDAPQQAIIGSGLLILERGLALRPDGEPAGSPARPHRQGDPGATPPAGGGDQGGVKPGGPARSAHIGARLSAHIVRPARSAHVSALRHQRSTSKTADRSSQEGPTAYR